LTVTATFLAENREELCAAHTDYVINEAALGYMRGHSLAGPVIAQLAAYPQTRFADQPAWRAYLDRLGISALRVTPDPMPIATEGALSGSIHAQGFLRASVVFSDDASQFAVGQHALCWVHAERLAHKLDLCTKLGIAFWDYLGARLGIQAQPIIPYLPDLIRCRGRPT
jgi:hypothetical protein